MSNLLDYKYILASKSPRRQELLKLLDIDFVVKFKEVPEEYPADMEPAQIPTFLAELKAKAFMSELKSDELLITADTVVIHENRVLGKPANSREAHDMLLLLSNAWHSVVTGVCLCSVGRQCSFAVETKVHFKQLTDAEITYYVETYQPFDKAGAYGIQEWIGAIGITHIEGSYYNVMGLPVQRLYEEILKFGE